MVASRCMRRRRKQPRAAARWGAAGSLSRGCGAPGPRADPNGCEARRSSCRATDQVWIGNQP